MALRNSNVSIKGCSAAMRSVQPRYCQTYTPVHPLRRRLAQKQLGQPQQQPCRSTNSGTEYKPFARSEASAAVDLNSSVSWVIKRRKGALKPTFRNYRSHLQGQSLPLEMQQRWFGTDVSGLPITPIFKSQALPLKMETR
jgi:hypothetical protein